MKAGDRIQLMQMDDPYALPVGSTGTVTRVHEVDLGECFEQVWVDWDPPHEHRTLMLSVPPDQVRVIS